MRPSRGAVLFAGRDLTSLSDVGLARVRRRIGFLPQDFALIPRLSVRDNVSYPLIPRGVRPTERPRAADAVLERMGLGAPTADRPAALSGGERQRVAIARALIARPEVVPADEPTSNLDASAAAVVLALFDEVRQAGGTTVVATHDPQLVAGAMVVYELARGHLVGVRREGD